MKTNTLVAAAALMVLPVAAHAQTPGFYVGAEGGLNWLFNFNATQGGSINGAFNPNFGQTVNVTPTTGWAAGGMIGYDFVGPRVEIETVYRYNPTNVNLPGSALTNQVGQLAVLANLLYDLSPNATVTPYIGAGAGVAFVDSNSALGSTVFAYQGIVGFGWNAAENLRVNLDGRYYGTTNPTVNGNAWSNANFSAMLSVQLKFGTPAVAAPAAPQPAAQATSYLVFFDWDRADLSVQALQTIRQAADAYRTKGSARITASGHSDRSGPENYNMALSRRRASAVKDALVRDGVPANAIAVVGRGEAQPMVPTADGVREPQNRRVEIALQ
jgi:outer membrane protein OmpA-like peptidoglycan-associated protein